MKTVMTILLVLLFIPAFNQTIISGRITNENGEGIPAANVFLLDTFDGSSADTQGNFEFETSESGDRVLVARSLGFREHIQPVVIKDERVVFTIVLEEAINKLKAVTITAGSFMASDESRRTVFRAVDIATTAGATADIAGALNTLPGTQKAGESGRLFVRGGDGSETRTFIDGLLVLDAYSPAAPNTPSRGRFLPFMFKGTSFSTGGYSSEYGQALSSTLVLDSKDRSETKRTDIGILSVGGDITHTQSWETGSVAGKIQYTNLGPYMGLINQEIDWKTPPVSMEGSSVFRQQIGKDGMLKFFGNLSKADFSLYKHDIDDPHCKTLLALTNRYHYLNGFYRDPLNENWLLRGGISWTSLKNNIRMETIDVMDAETGLHVKSVLEGSISDHVELKTGAEVITRNYLAGNSQGTGFEESVMAGFAETDVYASNHFVARSGARIEYNHLQKRFSVDPRFSLAYQAGRNGQVSLAYGKFRQSVKNEWLRLDHQLASEKADHYILNYQRISDNRTLRAEAYYKKYTDLVSSTTSAPFSNGGSGYARGIEFFWRDSESLRNTDYWLSYSFLDTKRQYLDFPSAAIPHFASSHNFSVVYKYFIQKIRSQLGMTYSFASPRPYHDPNSRTFNTGRTPSYHDLSFNWSYLPKPFLIVYFSCTNLTGRDNIFGYEYSDQVNEAGIYNGRAIRQPAPRFLFLGIFITLSKDKSVNQLPQL